MHYENIVNVMTLGTMGMNTSLDIGMTFMSHFEPTRDLTLPWCKTSLHQYLQERGSVKNPSLKFTTLRTSGVGNFSVYSRFHMMSTGSAMNTNNSSPPPTPNPEATGSIPDYNSYSYAQRLRIWEQELILDLAPHQPYRAQNKHTQVQPVNTVDCKQEYWHWNTSQ